MLSKDAYDSVIKDIQSEYTSDMYNLAETRATAIANGADVTSADKAMWELQVVKQKVICKRC